MTPHQETLLNCTDMKTRLRQTLLNCTGLKYENTRLCSIEILRVLSSLSDKTETEEPCILSNTHKPLGIPFVPIEQK